MSGFKVWCEIICAECATLGPGQTSTCGVPRHALKTEALINGWVLLADGKWYCPDCSVHGNSEL